ncbi:MAG TPA: hypothetical protein VNK43_12375, partial [Gemmatimonadales bacterium]|nr:hypothetical protein [Gemmatimonadales bacterium]
AVDGVPFLVALTDTAATEATMAPQAAQARAFYASMTPQQMEAQSRMAAATMVADSALAARIGRWGGASDPSTVGRAVAEMLTTDLRDEVAAIRTPVLLLAAGAGRPADGRARLEASYRAQLRAVPDAAVVVAERARHFIMYDDPEFFFRTLDRFLDRR